MNRATSTQLLGRVLVIVLALTPVAVLAGPSDSANSTSVSAANGVRYDSCRDHPYRYTIKTTGGWVYWDADITLYDPEGSWSDSDFLYDTDPTTGSGSFFICGFEPAGRWRLTIKVTYYNDSYNKIGTDSSSGTFVLRKPRTKTTYTVSTTRRQQGRLIRARISSKIERPAGFAPNRYEYVALESRKNGAWKRVKGTKTYTQGNGVGVVRVRKPNRRLVKVRAVTSTSADFWGSQSRAKRIR